MITFITVLVATISALSALISTLLTYKTFKNHRNIVKMETHLTLIKRIRDIQRNFDIHINQEGWIPNNDERRLIRMYWYHVFDQWLICCKEDYGLKPLWNNYYLKGICGALNNSYFKEDLNLMFQESLFFGYKDEFKKEIEKIIEGL